MGLTPLDRLEAEAIHVLREVAAQAQRPVLLYSGGKDSSVLVHLALKAFFPARPPFPLLHVATGWDFRDVIAFRDRRVADLGLSLHVHANEAAAQAGVDPFGSRAAYVDAMLTQALRDALDAHGFDAAIGGARRDEERSRAKERIISIRSAGHRWDPRRQRPELWRNYNLLTRDGATVRAFPLSNWTELDVWAYVHRERIPVAPLYFAAARPVVERDGGLLVVDDARLPLRPGERPALRRVRFRTLGCYPLTHAIASDAGDVRGVLGELLRATTSERSGRVVDAGDGEMERKKREGYF